MERTKSPAKERVSYSVQDEPLTISKQVLDTLLQEEKPADLISLYNFYYYTAKWQHTNLPKATTAYVANGLRWTPRRVQIVKTRLIELGLIENVKERNEKNQVTGHYIKVHLYCFDQRPTHVLTQPDGNQEDKCFITNNKKGISEFLTKFPDEWKHDRTFQKAVKDFYIHRKEKGKKLTPTSQERMAKKLRAYDKDTVIHAFNDSVSNGWTGVFPESVKKEENSRPPIYNDGMKYVWDPKIGKYRHSVSGNIYIP